MLSCTMFFLMLSSATLSWSCRGQSTPIYKNSHAPIEDRITSLLSLMTLEDKMSQLSEGDIAFWMNSTGGPFNATGLKANIDSHAGQFYVGHAVPQQMLADNTKIGQDYLVQNTTLGIPALVQSEGIHGLYIGNATIFNSAIGYACSFNPDLVENMAAAVAQEAQALGINQLFAPLGDLARELRYGRVEETFGEDGYLAGEIGYSYVKGLQNGNVSATVKHFAAYSSPEQGLNTGPVHGGEREFRMIVDTGAYSIMSAYSSYDGVAMITNHHVLTEILREEWGYKCWVTSDSGATDRICDAFKMCKSGDKESITLLALQAGNDVKLGTRNFNWQTIPELVRSGRLNQNIVDTAVSRILRAKFEMGLFDKSNDPASNISSLVHTPEHRSLARQLDAESIILLENHNETLPISKAANIAMIGPMADFMNYGDFVVNGSHFRGVTPYAGVKAASKGVVTYAKGCERWSNEQSGFAEAIATVSAADVAIVVVGTWSRDSTELWAGLNATTGEHVDVSSLNLVGAMPHLVSAIIATNVPTIVVFSSGKPITEPWISSSVAALVQQFYSSEEGGNALADVLFGDVNPSGKLSVGFPYDVGTTPVYYDYLNSGRAVTDSGAVFPNGTLKFGHQYVLNSPFPLYEFGYGKSHSTYHYSNLTLSKTENVSVDDVVVASVQVTNNSTRDGTEVVQLYVQDVISSVVVPNMQLRGFKKVIIPAGKTEKISIEVAVKDLGLWDIRMKYIVEPGEFVLSVGSSSLDLRANAAFTVT